MNKSIEIYNYIESDSRDYHMCRICLEEDIDTNLIYPCKCKGSTKYIHKNCLNEWRTTSENEDNFKRCELCHHEYKITQNLLIENSCKKDCRNIVKVPLPLFGFFIIASFLLGLLISYLDTGKILEREFEPLTCDSCLHPVYYVLGAAILLFMQFLLVLFWFCQVKNKWLYCKIYLSHKNASVSVGIAAILTAIIFGIMAGTIILELGIVRLFQIHFYSIDKLNTANMLDIENYEEDLELNLDGGEMKMDEQSPLHIVEV